MHGAAGEFVRVVLQYCVAKMLVQRPFSDIRPPWLLSRPQNICNVHLVTIDLRQEEEKRLKSVARVAR
jgi:hypothetical protein